MTQFANNGSATKESELPMSNFRHLVEVELVNARAKHKGANSAHEGYAIIKEEVDEFWDEVKRKEHRKYRMLEELVQIAAMCQRVAEDVVMKMTDNRSVEL